MPPIPGARFAHAAGFPKKQGSARMSSLPIPPIPPIDGPVEVNYDEGAVPPYDLPELLRFADGREVAAADWPERRREMLGVLASEMYGREPPPPDAFEWEVVEEGPTLGGIGIRRQCRVWFRSDRSGPHLDWIVLLPNRIAGVESQTANGRVVCENKAKVPVVLFLNYHGNHALLDDPEVVLPDNAWVHIEASRKDGTFAPRPDMRAFDRRTCDRRTFPVETILARGFAVMSCCYGQISPDIQRRLGDPLDLAWTGVFDLWGPRDPDSPDEPTSLGAWAWALSRGLDLAGRQPEIDASRAVVTGSSRLGKAALLAGARDERFAVVVPNQTGGGGAPLAKRFFGENVLTEVKAFPHWYCPAYRRYAGNEAALPFDQHWLLACVAPRPLLVQGFNEKWFDAKGEFLACRAASPAWELLGEPGLPQGGFPEPFDESRIGPRLGYVRRGGQHGLSAYDWTWMLDFAERGFACRGDGE